MTTHEFDKIVIGAGMAGLCCAGELTRLGERPLLIAETKEVGAMYRVQQVGPNNRAFQQHLTWQPSWGGGWWYPLARGLGIPLQLFNGFRFAAKLEGEGNPIVNIPMCASGSAVMDFLTGEFGMTIPEASAPILERCLDAALGIPHDELVGMNDVSLVSWLEELGADDMVLRLFLTFGGSPNGMSIDDSKTFLSVYGGLASLRAMLAGEAFFPMPYPNIREGICIPIADEVERRGGAVWKGQKVKRVLIEDSRAVGVEMADGRKALAPVVAIATGNGRIPALLETIPAEIEEALSISASAAEPELAVFALLDKPVVPAENDRECIGVINPETGYCHWVVPLHGIAPWLTEPGKQMVASWLRQSADQPLDDDEAALKTAIDLADGVLPGYRDAIETVAANRRPQDFTAPLLVGPKLPRTIPSVSGLWFVGDGSVPIGGIWSEGAASCGILGARQMLGR
jgi:glycine/D-amino acid oxidase-like deaminating enzyme